MGGLLGKEVFLDSNIDCVLVCLKNQDAHAMYRFLLCSWTAWGGVVVGFFVTRSGFLTKQMEGTLLPCAGMGRSRWPFERSIYWYWQACSIEKPGCWFAHQRWAHYPRCRDARDAHPRSHHHIRKTMSYKFIQTLRLCRFGRLDLPQIRSLQQHNSSF